MVPSTPLTSSSQEQLLASLLPKNMTLGKSRKYREAFSRRVKHHNYGRTNQFEIIERLDGVEEKFQVLNRDDLSDALRSRRAELRAHENDHRLLPDILDLLLHLSIDPADIKRSDRLISAKEEPNELPLLRWADIEENDPINHKDPIWQNPEYSDMSSNEDSLASSSIATSPQSVKRKEASSSHDESGKHADAFLEEQPDLLESEILAKFRPAKEDADGTVTFTEYEATRECLFMLQGLPTKLYSGDSTFYEIETRYSLRNVSQEVFWESLRAFARIGKRVEFVRRWLRETQTTQFTRKLQQSVAELISRFDAGTSQSQARLVRPQGMLQVSLLSTLEAATSGFQEIQVVCNFLQQCKAKQVDAVGQLETLFDLICSEQAAGRKATSRTALGLFMPMFELYLKPLTYWMRHGELHENLELFFVASAGQQKSLTNMWLGWFVLNETEDRHRVPRFLKDFSSAIFALGKTSLFLRRLIDAPNDFLVEAQSILPQETLTDALKSNYLSFIEAFDEAFSSVTTPLLSQTTAALNQQIDQQCGLWAVLDIFDCIYFGKHGPTTDCIETVLFRRLDKCNPSWSDRFLLLDLYEDAFADAAEVEPDRLLIHSAHTSSRSLENRRRSVKILGDLSVDYTLPWQIANIMPQVRFASYRRISLLLMQTRRARHSLERRAHIYVMNPQVGCPAVERIISCALYQKLLLFSNILYNHMTALALETSTSAMKTRMRRASTIDEMIKIHAEYVTNLEKACLTSKKLAPIRDTIISILDLCIRFSDLVSTPIDFKSSEDDARSFRSAASRHQKRRQDVDSEDEEDEISSGDEGYSTFVVLDELSPTEEFRRMNKDFDKHLTFVVVGLKSLGRVDGEDTWDILAGRLDWKQKSQY